MVEEEREEYSSVFPCSYAKEELEDSRVILPHGYGGWKYCRSRKTRTFFLTLSYFRKTIKSIQHGDYSGRKDEGGILDPGHFFFFYLFMSLLEPK